MQYNPGAAVQYVFDAGRNSASVSAFILPQLAGVAGLAQSAITDSVLRTVLAGLSSSPPLYNASYLSSQPAVAAFLVAPVIAAAVDLHPPEPYVFQLTITLGYIYMWIIAGASAGAIIGISKMLEGHLLVQYVVLYRMLANLCNNLVLSFVFSAVTTWMSEVTWEADVFFRFWLLQLAGYQCVHSRHRAVHRTARPAGSGRADGLPRAQPRLSRPVSGAGAGARILPHRLRAAAVPVPGLQRAASCTAPMHKHRQTDSAEQTTEARLLAR